MNRYRLTIYFPDKSNIVTTISSSLDIDEFASEVLQKFNVKDNTFISFIGDDIKYNINKNNILFYTIKLESR